MNILRKFFYKKHGTERGYVRHILANLEHNLGRLNSFEQPQLEKVNRIVFVCLGNICRSAYGHCFALKTAFPLPIASIGLSTTTGVSANNIAIKVADEREVNMHQHQATDLTEFEVQDGDLFLVMEVRHAHYLTLKLKDYKCVQIALLGSFCSPSHPHLHDPYSLHEDYFRHCFDLIENATLNLQESVSQLPKSKND